uniref:Golgi integral membrane protein 4 n=1 Tax=Callorhinchus milii TaxID=7868 RepID=A0A4W3K367_CALMI
RLLFSYIQTFKRSGKLLRYVSIKQLWSSLFLSVVYEHRSRLEKSLQKERNEHKKAKEDFLVYKLEAQEALNKEKVSPNQHEELKRQYTDLHEEHQRLGEDHSKAINEHGHRYLSLQQVKEQEIAKLKENIYNLLEENKKLRKAHQDVHIQLQDVRQEHKNLLLQHDQLQLTLEDHKNSLSAAQVRCICTFFLFKETVFASETLLFNVIAHYVGTNSKLINMNSGTFMPMFLAQIERKRRKSPYEEQLEQQKLANIRAEEARKLKEHQETLHQQRLKEYMERQQYLQKRERELQEEAERKELLLRQEQLSGITLKEKVFVYCLALQELEFQNEDVPEAEDEQDVREEEEEEEGKLPSPIDRSFRQFNHHIAGNPDQQEDNLDDQYQDEGEEEVQEDLIEEAKKVEENVEGPYTENENVSVKKWHVGISSNPLGASGNVSFL